eukprot:gene25295-biopygen5997
MWCGNQRRVVVWGGVPDGPQGQKIMVTRVGRLLSCLLWVAHGPLKWKPRSRMADAVQTGVEGRPEGHGDPGDPRFRRPDAKNQLKGARDSRWKSRATLRPPAPSARPGHAPVGDGRAAQGAGCRARICHRKKSSGNPDPLPPCAAPRRPPSFPAGRAPPPPPPQKKEQGTHFFCSPGE